MENQVETLVNSLIEGLAIKLDDIIIEGLKRKGFEFANKKDIESFIKANCKCEDMVHIKQRTYYVNNVPFLLHCYEIEVDLNPINTDREVKMMANYGSYTYL